MKGRMYKNAIGDKDVIIVIVDRQRTIIFLQGQKKQETVVKGDFVALGQHQGPPITAALASFPKILLHQTIGPLWWRHMLGHRYFICLHRNLREHCSAFDVWLISARLYFSLRRDKDTADNLAPSHLYLFLFLQKNLVCVVFFFFHFD